MRDMKKPLWHSDPKIKPSYYGKHVSLLPPTNVKQVLLHDNQTEARLLKHHTHILNTQKNWTGKIHNLQKKAFIIRQLLQQEILKSRGINCAALLPEIVLEAHRYLARSELLRLSYLGAKHLPLHGRMPVSELVKYEDKVRTGQLTVEGEEHPDTPGQSEGLHVKGERVGSKPTKSKTTLGLIPTRGQSITLATGKQKPIISKGPSNFGSEKPVKRTVTFYDENLEALQTNRDNSVAQNEALPKLSANKQTTSETMATGNLVTKITNFPKIQSPSAVKAHFRSRQHESTTLSVTIPKATTKFESMSMPSFPKLDKGSDDQASSLPQPDDQRFTALQRSLTQCMDKTPHSFAMLSPAYWGNEPPIKPEELQVIRDKYQSKLRKRVDVNRIHAALQTAKEKGS